MGKIKVGHSNLRQTGRAKFERGKRKSDGGLKMRKRLREREREEANPQWTEVMTGDTGERESSGRNEEGR